MQLIKNKKNGKVYKTKYPIENDKLCSLHPLPFIKSGVLSEEECSSCTKCMDKFPFIEVIGNVDGRTRGAKEHEWFTWLCVI